MDINHYYMVVKVQCAKGADKTNGLRMLAGKESNKMNMKMK